MERHCTKISNGSGEVLPSSRLADASQETAGADEGMDREGRESLVVSQASATVH